MVKRVFFSFMFALAMLAVSAQNVEIRRSKVVETYKGKQYYIHFVDQGQTLNAIARAYDVKAEDILKANPDVSENLRPDQMLMIPAGTSVLREEQTPTLQPQENKAVEITNDKPKPFPGQESKLHTIQPKETWYALSRQYQLPVLELIAANPGIDTLKIGMHVVIPEKKIVQPVELPAREGFKIHHVAPQETLYGIATASKTTVDQLLSINPELKDGLKAGQQIYVPSVTQTAARQTVADGMIRHEVQKKETLYSISKQYNVDIQDIVKANPGLGGTLRKNDVILIPVARKETVAEKPVETVVSGRDIHQEAVIQYSPKSKCSEGRHTRVFNVALMIPLQLEEVDSIRTGDITGIKLPSDYRPFDFIQFYEGALIAADQAAEKGINVKIHLFDADAGSGLSKTRRILAGQEIRNMDLIIGPFFASSFELVAEFAALHKIPVVNPLSQRNEIIESNTQVIKMQPSGWSVYTNAARIIASAYPDAIFTVMRKNDAENSSMAAAIHSSLSKAIMDSSRVNEVIYSQGYESGLLKKLRPGKNNVVFMLTSDKALIPALLRRLNDEREKYGLVVVGLKDWEDMETEFNYLHNLKAHFFTPWFVDYESAASLEFIKQFRSRFEADPEIDRYAYLGYDITRYFLDALYNFGPGFTDCLPSFRNPVLSSDFSFVRTPDGGLGNTAVTVYKLEDYKRVVVR